MRRKTVYGAFDAKWVHGDVVLDVHAYYSPYYPPTLYDPEEHADVEIDTVHHKGVDITALLADKTLADIARDLLIRCETEQHDDYDYGSDDLGEASCSAL